MNIALNAPSRECKWKRSSTGLGVIWQWGCSFSTTVSCWVHYLLGGKSNSQQQLSSQQLNFSPETKVDPQCIKAYGMGLTRPMETCFHTLSSTFIHFHPLSSSFICFHPLSSSSSTFNHFHLHSYTFIHFYSLTSTFIHFNPRSSSFIIFHPLSSCFILFHPLSSSFILYFQ